MRHCFRLVYLPGAFSLQLTAHLAHCPALSGESQQSEQAEGGREHQIESVRGNSTRDAQMWAGAGLESQISAFKVMLVQQSDAVSGWLTTGVHPVYALQAGLGAVGYITAGPRKLWV